MEDLTVILPYRRKNPTPTPKVEYGTRHSLTVTANGKVFNRHDYKDDKTWREAVAIFCGALNPNYTPFEARFDQLGAI